MIIRDFINIVETMGSTPDIDRIREIAEEFRAWMETDTGYLELRGHAFNASAGSYRRFAGLCNRASRKLAEIYRSKGFDASTRLIQYQLSDWQYWETHGRAFYKSDEDYEDGEAFEFGEDHEVVVIGDIIVDVTSDQFNPTNPEAHRVVVVHKSDDRYL